MTFYVTYKYTIIFMKSLQYEAKKRQPEGRLDSIDILYQELLYNCLDLM